MVFYQMFLEVAAFYGKHHFDVFITHIFFFDVIFFLSDSLIACYFQFIWLNYG